jgi:hypothetical protein
MNVENIDKGSSLIFDTHPEAFELMEKYLIEYRKMVPFTYDVTIEKGTQGEKVIRVTIPDCPAGLAYVFGQCYSQCLGWALLFRDTGKKPAREK